MEENNKMNISRHGFLKTATLAGAAMVIPSGLSKGVASKTRQEEVLGVDTNAARIEENHVLGMGQSGLQGVGSRFRSNGDDLQPQPTPGNRKILIAWFSRWGSTNYSTDVDVTTEASIIINNRTVAVRPKWLSVSIV